MEIHGIQKMTLLDYPEKVACTILRRDVISAVRSVIMLLW